MHRLLAGMARTSGAVAGLIAACAPALAGDLRARVVDQNGKPVADAVIAAKPVKGAAPAGPRDETIEQLDKEFVPHVKPVLAGSRVYFPNRDDVQHQVYSFSPAKRFELPLYSGTTAPPVTFEKPGIVTLGCNIHDWMVGYVYVTDTPYTATTGKDGSAILKDLPPGDYDVRVWQSTMTNAESATVKHLTLAKSGSIDGEWTIGVKPVFRIRRAPGPGRGGYR